MKRLRDCLILGFLLVTAACTEGTPNFVTLDEDMIPRPKFSGAFVRTLQTYSDALTFQINGECDPKIRRLTGTAVGTSTTFANIDALTVSGISVSCSADQKFSFELKSLAALGYTVSEGTVYEIQLRGETSAGSSKPSFIRILYSAASGGVVPTLITAGGTGGHLAIGTSGVSASVRITNKMNQRSVASQQANSDEASLKSGPAGSGISAHTGVRTSR